MKVLRYILTPLYRIWFYILLGLPIVVMFPLLLISILKKSWYPMFFKIARVWATIILFGMGFFPIIKRDTKFEKGKSYMFVSNHTSMTDIMLMLYVVRNPFVFVGKKELAKIPVFGFFYKRTCILVDRKDSKSRLEVFKQAQNRLKQGLSVCIFPEGGVPEDLSLILDEFKDGAFRLAIEHQIPIAPMTFHDNKKRFSYTFFTGGPGKMRVKVHELIPTKGFVLENRRELRTKTHAVIRNELDNPTI
ncbi:lysophospholipid acyltransferase family protein [Cochleicola gelatinilyticus]|uniref:Acyl-phosphate glycerol 3-phosphate acyltransferase n=1 Tax=Cochleicola gelatinilyticus TaxID=1763537 RepID=A0A167J033_9FLAO|nr:lysophospholipid acyltransferase family protein [Cochleicola gelatinilyticus]OAB80188.1 acyl-phosphate glycerol 3-phosphate acyltransferase [Cochleicola gelatinilyticus]